MDQARRAELRIASFIDYSDPLGGLLSWTADMTKGLPVDLTVVGVATDEARAGWASEIDKDSPGTPIAVTRQELLAAERARTDAELPAHLRTLIRDTDVFIPNAYETGYRLALVGRRHGHDVRIASFAHADDDHYYYLATRYQAVVSAFLAADKRSHAGLLERLHGRRDDIALIPHGVELPPLKRFARPEKRKLRIVYLGRVVRLQKRVFDLLPLAKALRALNVDFEMDVIGEGGEREEFESAARREGLHEVRSLGVLPRQEVLNRLGDYDSMVLCSDFEGLPMALVEAMASGVVPVVTDVGGARDVVTDGVQGYLWPVGHVSVAAERLRALWLSPSLLEGCGREARECIALRHNSASARERLWATLRSMGGPRGNDADVTALLEEESRSPFFPES